MTGEERAPTRRLRPAVMTPKRLLAAQRRYEQGMSLNRIARELEVNRSTLIYHVGRRGWTRTAHGNMERDGKNAICPGIGLCPVRGSAHRRLHNALLERIRESEERDDQPTATDRERDVRALAAMVRTLDKLTAMDREIAAAATAASPMPRGATEHETADDVEALRRDVAERVQNWLAGEAARRPVGDAAG